MLFSKPALIVKALVGAAICITPVSAASAACQAGDPGCVLPVLDAPPAVAPVGMEPLVREEGLGLLPILAGLGLAALLAFLLLDDDDEDEDDGGGVPISP